MSGSLSLLEFQLILVKILLLLRWVSTRTQISTKSETDLKYLYLKYTKKDAMNRKMQQKNDATK